MQIKGAIEALEADDRVCSNYHPTYVQKTLKAANNFSGGDAIFSFPVGPIKCAGAPQKIAYILEDIFTRVGLFIQLSNQCCFNVDFKAAYILENVFTRVGLIIQLSKQY